MNPALTRAETFCRRFGIAAPVLMAPMAGACPVALAAAVAAGGGLGACGALLMGPAEIADWAASMRAASRGAFQINLWVPDAAPARDPAHERRLRRFLADWGPEVPESAGDAPLRDFAAQCAAGLAAAPLAMSSIMGLFPPDVVAAMKARDILWLANVTTVAEARAAVAAGADVIVAQGLEAGGHRGNFRPDESAAAQVGLFALLPAVVDAVPVPVVATGGIADARGAAAALLLGASAVQIGTGLLRAPEAGIPAPWADALATSAPEDTMITRAFSGRLGRSLRNAYVRAASAPDAPDPAPYPVQRGLSAPMRTHAARTGNIDAMQAWAGQSAALAPAEPADRIVSRIWKDARAMLG